VNSLLDGLAAKKKMITQTKTAARQGKKPSDRETSDKPLIKPA
jgi:hypothetical protein